MDEIIEFLRARIFEDEKSALMRTVILSGGHPAPEVLNCVGPTGTGGCEWRLPLADGQDTLSPDVRQAVREHEDSHMTPPRRRMLSECLAKRELIEAYEELTKEHRELLPKGPAVYIGLLGVRRMQAAFSLGYLSLAYRDHPEWKEEWRP